MAEIPDTKTIVLRKPVSVGGQSFDRLELREPTAKEISSFMKRQKTDDEMAATVCLIALVSGVPEPAVAQIGVRDVQEAANYLTDFMDAGPDGGKT